MCMTWVKKVEEWSPERLDRRRLRGYVPSLEQTVHRICNQMQGLDVSNFMEVRLTMESLNSIVT